MKKYFFATLLFNFFALSLEAAPAGLCARFFNSPITYSSTLIRDLRKAAAKGEMSNQDIVTALEEQVRWNLQLQGRYQSDFSYATANANILVALDMVNRMSATEGTELLKNFVNRSLGNSPFLDHVHFDNGMMQAEIKVAIQAMRITKNQNTILRSFRLIAEGFAIGVLNYRNSDMDFRYLGVQIRIEGDLSFRYDIRDL